MNVSGRADRSIGALMLLGKKGGAGPLTGEAADQKMLLSRRATAAMRPPRSRKVSRRFALFSRLP